MIQPLLPAELSVQDFDNLHDDVPAWREAMAVLAAELALKLSAEPEADTGTVVQVAEGTVLVALWGADRVIKLYPPHLRDHCLFERAALRQLHGRLSLPTPALLAFGDHHGWPYTLMSRLPGEVLTPQWAAWPEPARCQLLHELGALAAQVHALPVGELAALAPPWDSFLRGQRERCLSRQQRTGLPAHLLQQLESFLDPLSVADLMPGPYVTLTGEYTPMNLMVQGECLSGMFDFGDGLVGPPEYDWLGPLCFLAAGQATRCRAFLSGYGAVLDDTLRLRLMRLLLLHRYSHLPAQLALADWQQQPDFENLAQALWP